LPVTQTLVARVGIVAKHGLPSDLLARLAAWLRERRLHYVFEADTAAMLGPGVPARSRDELPADVDLVVVLGGDGTLLAMAGRIARSGRDIPILGVNLGSLGFLTETRVDELYDALESVVAGRAAFEHRALLGAEAFRGGERFDARIVLNDVVFAKGALSRIIELGVSVGAGLVMKVKADGLIVASATGSTAYNLSAGGPIMHPLVDALVLTPIAPHTLTNRPIVIPGGDLVEVRPHVDRDLDDIYVTYDGQSGYRLQKGDLVRVRRSERVLRLVKPTGRSYFDVLREKLKWGERGG
jgi:NAD+ kinase